MNHPTLHWPQLGIKGSLRSFSPWNSFLASQLLPGWIFPCGNFIWPKMSRDAERCPVAHWGEQTLCLVPSSLHRSTSWFLILRLVTESQAFFAAKEQLQCYQLSTALLVIEVDDQQSLNFSNHFILYRLYTRLQTTENWNFYQPEILQFASIFQRRVQTTRFWSFYHPCKWRGQFELKPILNHKWPSCLILVSVALLGVDSLYTSDTGPYKWRVTKSPNDLYEYQIPSPR